MSSPHVFANQFVKRTYGRSYHKIAITVISKIAPGAIVRRIYVRRSEAKANHDWLTGEAHTERFLSFDAIHARMNH